MHGVERRSRQWTPARKKDSLQRVLDGSRGDANRLQQRLRQLVASWDSETPEGAPPGETMPPNSSQNEEEAAVAYDAYARKVDGPFARLNFFYTRPVPVYPEPMSR